jgi:hypothetical protein
VGDKLGVKLLTVKFAACTNSESIRPYRVPTAGDKPQTVPDFLVLIVSHWEDIVVQLVRLLVEI